LGCPLVKAEGFLMALLPIEGKSLTPQGFGIVRVDRQGAIALGNGFGIPLLGVEVVAALPVGGGIAFGLWGRWRN
jgi:hypothetical protein